MDAVIENMLSWPITIWDFYRIFKLSVAIFDWKCLTSKYLYFPFCANLLHIMLG